MKCITTWRAVKRPPYCVRRWHSIYLYFEHRDGRLELIGKEIPHERILNHIHTFIRSVNPHFKSYYTREIACENGVYSYDVGSHTEFFWASPEPLKEVPNL